MQRLIIISLLALAAFGQTKDAGPRSLATLTYATLGTPADGTVVYCSDCTRANPTAGSGSGAVVRREGGAWNASAVEDKIISIEVADPDTTLTTGNGKRYWTIPAALNGMNLVAVHSQLVDPGTVTGTSVQVARCAKVTGAGLACSGTVTDMLSTALTTDATENNSADAATPAVIDAAADDVSTGQVIRIDVDTVPTAGKGLVVTLTFRLP